ncbi:MAG: hypothetical protein ACRCYY_20455 [Trueperaceae bacterium]
MKLQKQNITVLLFDLGNVIINVNFARAIKVWSDYAQVTPEVIKSRFVFDAAYERHERNEITGAEYLASLRTLLDVSLTDAQLKEGWNAIYEGEVAGIQNLLEEAKKQFVLYVFSNTNPTHWAALLAICDSSKPRCAFKLFTPEQLQQNCTLKVARSI